MFLIGMEKFCLIVVFLATTCCIIHPAYGLDVDCPMDPDKPIDAEVLETVQQILNGVGCTLETSKILPLLSDLVTANQGLTKTVEAIIGKCPVKVTEDQFLKALNQLGGALCDTTTELRSD